MKQFENRLASFAGIDAYYTRKRRGRHRVRVNHIAGMAGAKKTRMQDMHAAQISVFLQIKAIRVYASLHQQGPEKHWNRWRYPYSDFYITVKLENL